MSPVVIKVMLALGIVGHALNLYCDRPLSVTPNGTLAVSNFKDLHDGSRLAQHFEGVSPAVPMRSAILDAAPATRLCYDAYIGMVVTLIVTLAAPTLTASRSLR